MQIPDVVIIDDDENDQPNLSITNCERSSPQRPLIVVSPGSPQPSNGRERDVPPTPRKGSTDSLSPREKNIAFWRSTSKDSTFSTMDDDEEDEELTRLADQIVVNVLSPPPTPSPEVPIEFAAATHCNGHLNLPGFGNAYNAKTPEPTLNSLQATSLDYRGRSPVPDQMRGRSPIPVPVDACGQPLGRYYLMSPSPVPSNSTSSSSPNSLSPGYLGTPRRFSLIPLTPDLRAISPCNRAVTPSDWSNQPASVTPSEIVLHPYLNELSDSERQWVLMEHNRTVSTASLGSLTDALSPDMLNGGDLPPIQFNEKEDFGALAECNMIGSCNADPSGRMCVSIACCRVPKNTADWDRILRFGLVQLDKICDNDYSLVYFHHGYEKLNKPTWKWLVTCYRSFDRKFKKNIKAFYIVHPSTKLKMVFRFMKPLVSIRAHSKIVYCQRLSELAQYVMLDRLDIPLEVRAHDKNLRARSVDNMTNTTGLGNYGKSDIPAFSIQPGFMRVFGGTLSDTDEVPQVVTDCIQYLSLPKNLREEGLFRRCGNASELKVIKECYNTGQNIELSNYCPHTIAAALKTYLRELSTPLLTFEAYPTVSSWSDFAEDKQKALCKKLLENIPPVHYSCLRLLILFLNKVISSSSQNLMTSQNLAIVIGPNLTWSRHTITTLSDINNINSFTQFLIDSPQMFDRESDHDIGSSLQSASTVTS